MWVLIFITIALRFSPKRLENFIGFNHKASDLGNDHLTYSDFGGGNKII
jgi:hypothetical protein